MDTNLLDSCKEARGELEDTYKLEAQNMYCYQKVSELKCAFILMCSSKMWPVLLVTDGRYVSYEWETSKEMFVFTKFENGFFSS